MTEFSSHPPSVEEVIDALEETQGYDDRLPISFKKSVITGPRSIVEGHCELLSKPFSETTLGLIDIIQLVGELVYPMYDQRTTDDSLQAEVTAFVGSNAYELACMDWDDMGKDNDEITRAFKRWQESIEREKQETLQHAV